MVVSSNPSMSNVTGDLECSGGLRLNNQRQKLRQRFDIVRKLGQGTYGKVQLATNKDSGEEVAIKTIKKAKIETEQDLVRIQREIQIMSSVQHPHIIHIYEVFENKEKIVLVMEYACGGELYDYLSFKKSLSETEARRIFRQVVSAVFYCHKNKICHRDLKLENILLDEKGNAKIADFGLSNIFDEKRLLDTFCGSPLYASPEIVKGMPYYGPEVDCWSLGVLLYTLVYGAMPFDGSNFRRLVKQISDGDYYEPKKPSDASRLIRRLLTVLPNKRATIEDVCEDWWVNLGYDDCLLALAEDMCKATPVRLDYLLQLATPAMSEPASVDGGNAIDGLSVEEIKSAGKLNTEENLNIQCERSEDSMDTDVTVDNKNGDVKKHQLTSSERSLSSVTENSAKKRQKTDEKENERCTDNVVDLKEGVETDVVGLKDGKEATETDESANGEEESVPTITPFVENEEPTDVAEAKIAASVEEDKEKLTIVEVTEEKPEEKQSKSNNEDAKAKPKLRTRSASLKTPDKLNLNANKDGKDSKKSLLFPALKVSEARRAFETKPPEKRSVVIPGLKVSAARKAFEAPASCLPTNVARRASMPAKLSDKTRKQSTSPQPEVEVNSTPTSTTTTTATTDSVVPVKMMGFLPTLDVTMAVKPKKDAGKPPPVPRMETSATSGTSSGENTPDDVPKPPPHLKLPSPRRASCPKTTASVTSSTSSMHDTESRTRTMSESDSLSLNAITTSTEQSLKSSTSTLTGGESVEWGSMASVASSKDFGTQSESSIVSRDDYTNEEREVTPTSQTKQEAAPPKVTKVSSMEIKLNSDVTPPVKSQMAEPQLVLRQAPGGGKFTLLGVTSEVTFDVAAAPTPEESCETATVELKNAPQQKNSNLFMSVTLPPPPPPDGDASSPEVEREPEKPPSFDQTPEEEETQPETKPKQYNKFSSYEREDSTGGPGERYFREISKDSEEMSSQSSHQGYSVYRSKFRSLQKAFLGEESSRQREPSVEHSESFSSTGSTDELEDIFDSLATGDSMLSNILGRTRSIIEEFARDDITMAARRHSHSFLRRIPGMPNLRSSDFYSKLDSLRSYADNISTASSSGIGSTRSSRLSRQPPSDHESSTANSRNSWRSGRTQSAPTPTPTRDLGPDVESYLNDSTAKSRWFNRSTSREEEAESSARSNTSQRRSVYTSNFSRSMSRSISEEDSQTTCSTQNVDAKNDTSSSSTSSTSQYHSAQRDSASSLNSQKRSSLSSRFRSGCCPPSSAETPTTSGWNSGYSRHQSWSEDHQSTSQEQNKQQYQYSSSSLNRNRTSSVDSDQIRRARAVDSSSYLKRDSSSYGSGSSKEPSESSSVYGTLRRPKNVSRYGRAATHELLESGYKSGSQDEDSTSCDSGRPRRPRSLLVLSDSNEDNSEWSSRGRKESTSSTIGSGHHRSSRRFDDVTAASTSTGNNDKAEGQSGDVKKKSEAELESRSGPNQIPRTNHFGFRRTPSQERTFESASTCPRETPTRDQVPLWRASSHGREIPSSPGGGSSWSRSRFCDDIKPGLVRRASLSEAPPKEKLVSPGGAAGYWAKRYGTTSRVPQRRASAGKADESGDKKKEEDDILKTFIPRRRSTVGFESDSEVIDELDRTRGLLRYARSISHEMDQLQNDLCARFGMINKMKKSSQSETEREETKRTTKSDVGNVVNELNKLEDDLLKFGETNKASVKSEQVTEESVSESKTSESESKEEKSISKDDDIEGSEDGITTPTDMDDSCSICSDYENRSGGGLDESVSERIRRKSYFARFQDSRRKHHHGSLRAGSEGVESVSVPVPVRCRHQVDQSSSENSNKNKTKIVVEDERGSTGRPKFERNSISAARDVGNGYATLPKSSPKRNHFLETRDATSPNERSVSPETNHNVNGKSESPSSPQPTNNNNITKESSDILSDNRDDHLSYRHLRAGSVVPEMMEPGGSSGYSSTKSFLRQRSACDPLRPTSPLSRRLSMLDSSSSSPISNGDIHSSHHLPSSWSSFERRKSRPLASIISSLPLEATVQSRAKLRSRHDYLINRALSSLDERYTRPISPTSRRSYGFHDNHASPPSDLRRFSAILDNASPRDVIRKALDVCNSLQY